MTDYSIVGITQGANQPSTRFRWFQYLDYLRADGFSVAEMSSHFGAYAPSNTLLRPLWVAGSLMENAVRVGKANSFDIRFLQRNLTATLCTWEPLLKKPCVFNVDDAIFLGSRGSTAYKIARSASLIICGNVFLANHFERCGPVEVLPTAVDTQRFLPGGQRFDGRPVIGWSGSSSGLQYLYEIEPAILIVLNKYPDSLLKIMCNAPPSFKLLPPKRVVYEQWSPAREVAVLQEFDIGIMPLDDSLWARGKCSFKMLTYMAVGRPVVVSPVGMNAEVLAQGDCGFAASSHDDWVNGISSLLNDPGMADQMGSVGREIVEARYARKIVGPQLASLLRQQL